MQFPFSTPSHPVSRRLAQLMCDKQSNLAVSADVTDANALLQLAKEVADEIVVLKTHIDIICDFTPALTRELRALADNAGFLIFEDRKFADIGNTVRHQVKEGIYQIAEWADIINAHLLPGTSVIEGLYRGCRGRDVGLLLLAQMSSDNNFFMPEYTKAIVDAAKAYKDFVIGFIAQEKLTDDPDLITMTPGVSFADRADALGQKYHTPKAVLKDKKSDIIIVGRGIYAADNPKSVAADYRKNGWTFLQERLA